jgi:hypothetical protein
MEGDIKRKKIEMYWKLGIGFAAVLLIAPLTGIILSGLLGLAGLAVGAVVGLAAIQMAPVIATKFANWKMKTLVKEVEANPIETLQNLYIDKTKELQKADQNIADFETEIRNFDDQTKMFKQQYPEEASSYEELSGKMHEGLTDMKQEQKTARHELKNTEMQIKKAQAIYKMALAAQRVTALSKSAEAQVFAQIKEQVAFDSVRTQLNRAFSNLNVAIERRADHQVEGRKLRPVELKA